jgi:hypothetical protein
MGEQKRGRRIALNAEELDAFLTEQRTCRIGTVSPTGPHVTPLWFLWHDQSIWLYSIFRSQRWTDITRDPRVSVLVDDGHEYSELRGVEICGKAEVIGEVPRVGSQDPVLEVPERLMAEKYFHSTEMVHDERHAWLRITPVTIRSWDFRKIP